MDDDRVVNQTHELCVTSVWVSPELNAVFGLLPRGAGSGELPVQCSAFWALWCAGSCLGPYILLWSVTAPVHLTSNVE